MATLSVLKFPTADGAQQVVNILLELQKQHVIEVQDAAIVSWPRWPSPSPPASDRSAGQLIRQRRSAVDFDGVTRISRVRSGPAISPRRCRATRSR